MKNQKNILAKFGIEQLNPMQEDAQLAIHSVKNTLVLSPTGSGKTLAFLLPLVAQINTDLQELQVLVIVPTRELALQIEQVVREMGAGIKAHAFYGGRNFVKDREELNTTPQLIIGTPGRIGDHLKRSTIDLKKLQAIVLDEFDKSLEIGFESEMKEIFHFLPLKIKKILTSATQGVEVPQFVKFQDPAIINNLEKHNKKLSVEIIVSQEKDKINTLIDTLHHLQGQPGIIFLNFKDSIQRVSDQLEHEGIGHGCFYGGLEQQERERSLIKFRNGSHQLLLATDLAARGLDIPEIKFIIHYHLPLKAEEFTHRNGRTARMHNEGIAYVIKWKEEYLPDFIENNHFAKIPEPDYPLKFHPSEWKTVFLSGGRKDKISKGDLAGFFYKNLNLPENSLGTIELKTDCSFVAIKTTYLKEAIAKLNGLKLKKRKIRIYEI